MVQPHDPSQVYRHLVRILGALVGAGTIPQLAVSLDRSLRDLLPHLFLGVAIWDRYEDDLKIFLPRGRRLEQTVRRHFETIFAAEAETGSAPYAGSAVLSAPILREGGGYFYDRRAFEEGVTALLFIEFTAEEDRATFSLMAEDLVPQFWSILSERYVRVQAGEESDMLWRLTDAEKREEDWLNEIELNQLLQNLLQLSLRKLGAKIGTILLLDEKTGEFNIEPRAVIGKAISVIPEKFSTKERSITAIVYRTNRYYICNDTDADPNYYPIFQGIKSSLIVPIAFQGRCIGVIAIESQRKNRFAVVDAEKLQSIVRTATMFIRRAQLYRETARRGDAIMIFGRTDQWKEVEKKIEKASKTDATVILRGESGTGKELVAHAIHFNSPRKEKPFVTINCAAIPADLLESEMFGHVKGAFTGAYADKIGEFEKADGGTIFLDEIGDLPILLQVKLLRTLQSGEIRPVGSNKPPHRVNVRVIAATGRNLEEMTAAGTFRLDIYYRLHVVPVWLPALRDYREDIPFIVENFIRQANERFNTAVRGVDKEALGLLMRYDYPGNMRQLNNFIQQAVIMADGPFLRAEHLPQEIRDASPGPIAPVAPSPVRGELPRFSADGPIPPYLQEKERVLAEFSLEYLRALLAKSDGNIKQAAHEAGISRMALYKLMERYAIRPRGEN